jgi:SAM-dependent methyltransferase
MMADPPAIDGQRQHWQRTFAENPHMYGEETSDPGQYALDLFAREHARDVLELGAGQGRDTLAFLAAGMQVTALDYEADALRVLHAEAADRAASLRLIVHDVRDPLPVADETFDALYSHMLFNMALSTDELERLAREVNRVLRPGGWHVYTVRHTGDAHYGTGTALGDGMFENGGFIVHFFDRALVDRLSEGFSIVDIHDFEEGALPRKLWRVTVRKRHRDSA